MSPATASWLGIDQDGLTSTMRTQRLERYVLRHEGTGDYLRVNEESQEIERSSSPELAWGFHTHDGAVTHAIWIGEVFGQTPDVVKMI